MRLQGDNDLESPKDIIIRVNDINPKQYKPKVKVHFLTWTVYVGPQFRVQDGMGEERGLSDETGDAMHVQDGKA